MRNEIEASSALLLKAGFRRIGDVLAGFVRRREAMRDSPAPPFLRPWARRFWEFCWRGPGRAMLPGPRRRGRRGSKEETAEECAEAEEEEEDDEEDDHETMRR